MPNPKESLTTLPRRGTYPIRKLFRRLSTIAVCAALILILADGWRTLQNTRAELTFRGQLLSQSIVNLFEEYEGALTLLSKTLPSDPEALLTPATQQQLRLFAESHSRLGGVGLISAEGLPLIASQRGQLLSAHAFNLRTDDETQSSFLEALDGPGLHIGRTYQSPVTGEWIMPLRLPLPPLPAQYLLGIGLRPQDPRLSTLSANSLMQVVREDGYLQLQMPAPPGRYYLTPLPATFLQQLDLPAPYPHFLPWMQGFDGQWRTAIVSELPHYHLKVIVSMPIHEVLGNWMRTTLPGLLLLMALIVVAHQVYRRVRREQARQHSQLVHALTHDQLTGMLNRLSIKQRLQKLLQDKPEAHCAVVFIDLNQFKRINDNFGHAIGDRVIQQVAQRLRQQLPPDQMIGRQGGDEFLVIIPDQSSPQVLKHHVQMIYQLFQEPFALDHWQLHLVATLGIACAPDDGGDAETLLRNADTALYNAKQHKRGSYLYYDQHMNQLVQRRFQLESRLRQAIHRRELQIYYQPQVDMATGLTTGCEALLRWSNPELGAVSPAEFIPLAEEIGLIDELGHWVLENACAEFSGLKGRLAGAGVFLDLTLSINLSARQILDPHLPNQIQQLLNSYRLHPKELVLEITETTLIDDFERSRATLAQLQTLQISTSIDDFGTGYSSLSYLSQLPVNELKIDQAFVRDILKDPQDASLVKAIINLGQSLQLDVVAEGVEEQAQAEILAEAGCHRIQGYWIGHPMPITDFQLWLLTPQRHREWQEPLHDYQN